MVNEWKESIYLKRKKINISHNNCCMCAKISRRSKKASYRISFPRSYLSFKINILNKQMKCMLFKQLHSVLPQTSGSEIGQKNKSNLLQKSFIGIWSFSKTQTQAQVRRTLACVESHSIPMSHLSNDNTWSYYHIYITQTWDKFFLTSFNRLKPLIDHLFSLNYIFFLEALGFK